MSKFSALPAGVSVVERGWLSANSIFFRGASSTAVVDTGYCTHSAQTVALIKGQLRGQPLDLILNTHLHSDHCGGNAALQLAFPNVQTLIPPGLAIHVQNWDPTALTYLPTGQECPRFRVEGLLSHGSEISLGGLPWEVHAAPGHDQHSVILFQRAAGVLISADALWENGFGVVFQELEGDKAFNEVAMTLDLIESLAPRVIVPGHGSVFLDLAASLETARRRLDGFTQNPAKHASHAIKVLLKFKLLDVQRIRMMALCKWASETSYFSLVLRRWFPNHSIIELVTEKIEELERSGAVQREGDWVLNA